MIPYPKIDPVFLRIGPLSFRWYGLMYAVSFVAAIFLVRAAAAKKRLKLTKDQVSDLILYAALGVILGGRLGYILFYNFNFYLSNPAKLIAVWEGGMSFHGGFLGVITAGYLFCRSRKLPFFAVADVAVISVPVGLGLGRLGNFINGELYGRATDVPWCMVFPAGGAFCRHPSQLYEAFLEGIVLFVILFFLIRADLPRGVSFWSLILFYGLFRFIVEFFREPDAQLGLILGPFSMGQILSFPMFVLGVVMVIRAFRLQTGDLSPMSRKVSR
jgi:phosphatidylglycerol:prolipoprotein diacylglycerol transferase